MCIHVGMWQREYVIMALLLVVGLSIAGQFTATLLSNSRHNGREMAIPTNILIQEGKTPKLLVTGAASFMGYYTILAIHKAKNDSKPGSQALRNLEMVLVDDFDKNVNSTDLARKRSRQIQLEHAYGLTVKETSVCENLESIIHEHDITMVFHAHDAVRLPSQNSLDAQRYRSKCLQCFSNLLTSVKAIELELNTVIPIVYLSSALVTEAQKGNLRNIDDITRWFIELKSEQELAVQSHSKGIAVALRMFHVYGELGMENEPLERLWRRIHEKASTTPLTPFYSLDIIHAADAGTQIAHCVQLVLSSLNPTSLAWSMDIGTGKASNLDEISKLTMSISSATQTARNVDLPEAAEVYSNKLVAQNPPVQTFDSNPGLSGISSFFSWVDKSHFPKGIVLSNYLTLLPDPQRKTKWHSPKDTGKITTFYKSAVRLGLTVYIIHDGLDMASLRQLETVSFKFIHVDELYRKSSKSEIDEYDSFQSNNDRRYFCFRKLMQHIMEEVPNSKLPKYVLITDLFDVHFRLNPWDLFDKKPNNTLFMGQDRQKFHMPWMQKRMKFCNFTTEEFKFLTTPRGRLILNPGILGGRFSLMLEFLEYMMKALRKSNREKNCNLAITNYVAYRYFSGSLVSGHPLNSKFMSFGKQDGDAYIIHK